MITSAATLIVSHDVLRQAVQEYLARHFVPGSCPKVEEVQLHLEGNPASRLYRLRLEAPDTTMQPAAPFDRSARQIDVEA